MFWQIKMLGNLCKKGVNSTYTPDESTSSERLRSAARQGAPDNDFLTSSNEPVLDADRVALRDECYSGTETNSFGVRGKAA
jgi:hypothetical protein